VAGIIYNGRMPRILQIVYLAAVTLLFIACGCNGDMKEHDFPEIYTSLDLETRLQGVDFSLVETNRDAVMRSWEELDEGRAVPETWELAFSGSSIALPPVDPEEAIGILHSNGRSSVIYPMPDPDVPEYGEIMPLAVAHYRIPQNDLDIVLLLVCFQADPDGSLEGIGVRSVDRDGTGLSAPFALALRPGDLEGKFFYDEFIAGTSEQGVAARVEWDQGIMLVSRLSKDVILSTYVPWY